MFVYCVLLVFIGACSMFMGCSLFLFGLFNVSLWFVPCVLVRACSMFD